MKITPVKTTPMMQQWHRCKKEAKEAILFFRMGDFYEAFYEDAKVMARELNLTLTKRQNIPMAGIPYHTSDTYVDRLVAKGFSVAIAEQTESPKQAKGLVNREVIRFVTPGTLMSSSLLQDKCNNFFACLSHIGQTYALALLDLSTGEFKVIEMEIQKDLYDEILRLAPSEILINAKFSKKNASWLHTIKSEIELSISESEDWIFDLYHAQQVLIQHFKVSQLEGYGLSSMSCGISACGALLYHLKNHLKSPLEHIKKITPYDHHTHLLIDPNSLKNLELFNDSKNKKKISLWGIIDHTLTAMGGRLLRKWLQYPLINKQAIDLRLDSIEEFIRNPSLREDIQEQLSGIKDIERLMIKIVTDYASPRDLIALKISLQNIPTILTILSKTQAPLLHEIQEKLHSCPDTAKLIDQQLVENPPLKLTEGLLFKPGLNKTLDELRLIQEQGKQWILDYQQQLRKSSGIKTLKIGFTKAFGYYIDVSKAQAKNIPPSFIRRQTLVNNERFISKELKEYEEKVLHAEEKIILIEQDLFKKLKSRLSEDKDAILSAAAAIAELDALYSLSAAAQKWDYCKPTVSNDKIIDIKKGRHPIIESSILSETFVPNDTYLDDKEQSMFLITGPNMAGKSTYIRQVALITILAQMGSFVPATEASIGIVDKIFTRIGASDNLAKGQSTFMVEMSEAAYILNNATSCSLVILDEIGRGTSTYDGISIAWSIAEYLIKYIKAPKTLFATHYFELTQLEYSLPGIKNFHISVEEVNDSILFSRKILPGFADKSYGIHVAKLAGIPFESIHRAQEILFSLEKKDKKFLIQTEKTPLTSKKKKLPSQLLLFPQEESSYCPIRETILNLNLLEMTPLQAMQKLDYLQKEIKTLSD